MLNTELKYNAIFLFQAGLFTFKPEYDFHVFIHNILYAVFYSQLDSLSVVQSPQLVCRYAVHAECRL